MVKEAIDVLGLVRKRGVEGDVDFLREALAVLVQAIMEAEVTEQVGADSQLSASTDGHWHSTPYDGVGYWAGDAHSIGEHDRYNRQQHRFSEARWRARWFGFDAADRRGGARGYSARPSGLPCLAARQPRKPLERRN